MTSILFPSILGMPSKTPISDKLEVKIKDDTLGKQFGTSLPFYIKNKSVNFDILNLSHSDLYALNSSISKAISEQCHEIL